MVVAVGRNLLLHTGWDDSTGTKEHSFTSKKLAILTSTISDNIDVIRTALNTRKTRQKPTRERLERIATDLGLQCFVDTIIKDDGFLTAIMISGSIVVVDVEMNESDDNICQRVGVSFAIETDKDSRIDKILLKNLQEDCLHLFQQNLELLSRLDRQTSESFDAFHCIRIICSDLEMISRRERSQCKTLIELLTIGHGLVLTHQSILWSQIYFWLPAAYLESSDSTGAEQKLEEGARMARILLEPCRDLTEAALFLPPGHSTYLAAESTKCGAVVMNQLSPLLNDTSLSMLLFPSPSSQTALYRYVLRLDQPVIVSQWTWDRLRNICAMENDDRAMADEKTELLANERFISLEECLLHDSPLAVPYEDCRRILTGSWFQDSSGGSWLSLGFNSQSTQPCRRLKSVPFRHPSQIHKILQLLRLQLTFNELLGSCFVGQCIPIVNDSELPSLSVQIYNEPLTIDLRVTRGGEIRLKIQLSPEDPCNPGISIEPDGQTCIIMTDEESQRIQQSFSINKSIPLLAKSLS